MKGSRKSILNKARRIKLVLTDVDGVLTDGGMYFSKNGEEMKKFYTRDGMGVELLLNKGIKTVFITKEKSEIAKQRGKKVKASEVILGVQHKESLLPKLCMKFNVKNYEIAYVGDDVNDLNLMSKVGLTACPKDAISQVIKIADYICKKSGGNGAFREFTELILKNKK